MSARLKLRLSAPALAVSCLPLLVGVLVAAEFFAPFVSPKPTGLGPCLSVCRRIADAHGGEIITSDRRGGADLTSRLPDFRGSPASPLPAA